MRAPKEIRHSVNQISEFHPEFVFVLLIRSSLERQHQNAFCLRADQTSELIRFDDDLVAFGTD